jgi:hypothetical protein
MRSQGEEECRLKKVKIGSGIRHPLGRFCTPKRSKSARQMRTKSKLAKIASTTIYGSVKLPCIASILARDVLCGGVWFAGAKKNNDAKNSPGREVKRK